MGHYEAKTAGPLSVPQPRRQGDSSASPGHAGEAGIRVDSRGVAAVSGGARGRPKYGVLVKGDPGGRVGGAGTTTIAERHQNDLVMGLDTVRLLS